MEASPPEIRRVPGAASGQNPGVVGDRRGQAAPEELSEGNGGANRMGAAGEVAKAVEALDGKARVASNQPSRELLGSWWQMKWASP